MTKVIRKEKCHPSLKPLLQRQYGYYLLREYPVCNPRYASKILDDDANRGVTAFMPLAIGVFEDKKGQVFVSQLNVGLLGMMFGGTIADVMGLAGKDLNEVVASAIAK